MSISELSQKNEILKEVYTLPCLYRVTTRIGRILCVKNPLEILDTSDFRISDKNLVLHVRCNFPFKTHALKSLKIDTITGYSLYKGVTILASRIRLCRRQIDVKIMSKQADCIIFVEFDPIEFHQLDPKIRITFRYEIFNRPFCCVHNLSILSPSLAAVRRFLISYKRDFFPKLYPNYLLHFQEVLRLKLFRSECQNRMNLLRQRDEKFISYFNRLKRNRSDSIFSGQQLIVFSENFEKVTFKFPDFDASKNNIDSLESAINVFIYLTGVTKENDNQILHMFKSGLFSRVLEFHKIMNYSDVNETEQQTKPRISRLLRLIEHVILLTLSKINCFEHINDPHEFIEQESKTIFDVIVSSYERSLESQDPKFRKYKPKSKSSLLNDTLKLDHSNLRFAITLFRKYQSLRERFFSHDIESVLYKNLRSNMKMIYNDSKSSNQQNNTNMFKEYSKRMTIIKNMKYAILILCEIILSDGARWKSRIQLCKKFFLMFSSASKSSKAKLSDLLINPSRRRHQQSELLIVNLLSFPSKDVVRKMVQLIAFSYGFNPYYQFLKKESLKLFWKNRDEIVHGCRLIDHHFFTERLLYKLMFVMKTCQSEENVVTCVSCILISLMKPFIYNDIEHDFMDAKSQFRYLKQQQRQKRMKMKKKKKKKNEKLKSMSSSQEDERDEELDERDVLYREKKEFDISPVDEVDRFDYIFRAVQCISKYGREVDQMNCVSHFLYIFQSRKPLEEVIKRLKSLLDLMNDKGMIQIFLNRIEDIIEKNTISRTQDYEDFIFDFFSQKENIHNNHNNNTIKRRKRRNQLMFKRNVQHFSLRDLMLVGSMMLFPNWWVITDPNYKKKVCDRVDGLLRLVDDNSITYWRSKLNESKKMNKLPVYYDYFINSMKINTYSLRRNRRDSYDYFGRTRIRLGEKINRLYVQVVIRLLSETRNRIRFGKSDELSSLVPDAERSRCIGCDILFRYHTGGELIVCDLCGRITRRKR